MEKEIWQWNLIDLITKSKVISKTVLHSSILYIFGIFDFKLNKFGPSIEFKNLWWSTIRVHKFQLLRNKTRQFGGKMTLPDDEDYYKTLILLLFH